MSINTDFCIYKKILYLIDRNEGVQFLKLPKTHQQHTNDMRTSFYHLSILVFLAAMGTAGYACPQDSVCLIDTTSLAATATATGDTTGGSEIHATTRADTALMKPSRQLTLYDLPYSRKTRMENWKRLSYNTATFVGAGILTLFVLECLPEGATAWDKSELKHTAFWHRYGNHVKQGPVWDKDNFVFNYILHPYGGAVYYMGARSNGFNMLGSFLYSSFVSNVLWEYGIEAFMEIPSIQDLMVTPIVGSLVGESFYRLKRKIVRDDYTLFGSKAVGATVAWLIDPLNEFVSLFAGNPCKHPKAKPGQVSSISCAPGIHFMGKHPQFSLAAIITL